MEALAGCEASRSKITACAGRRRLWPDPNRDFGVHSETVRFGVHDDAIRVGVHVDNGELWMSVLLRVVRSRALGNGLKMSLSGTKKPPDGERPRTGAGNGRLSSDQI